MLNPRELEILNILWSSEVSMTSVDIIEQGHRLSQSTVQAVLRKLLKAGLVEVTGSTHSGNVLSRLFKPTEESREVIKNQFVESYTAIEHVVSKHSVIAAMLKNDTNEARRAKEIEEVKKMLEDMK